MDGIRPTGKKDRDHKHVSPGKMTQPNQLCPIVYIDMSKYILQLLKYLAFL